MSKTLTQVYEEVLKSTELQNEYLAAEQNGTIMAFAAAHGCDATAEEVQAFLKEKLSDDRELSLDELDQVAGGKSDTGKVTDQPIEIQIDGGNPNIDVQH